METSCVIHQAYVKKFPERQKEPQRSVWEEDLCLARAQAAYKVRELKGFQREDPREYTSLKSLRRHVLNGDDHGIMCCVKNGVDLNKPFPDGGGPALIEAASKGDMKLIKTLLELKANPARGNANGYSPLMAAIDGGYWEAAGLIFEGLKPSEIVATTKSGLSVLKVTARRRNAAESQRQELSSLIIRGVLPPHDIGAVMQKLEAAKTEREQAGLFYQDLLMAVEKDANDLYEGTVKSQASASAAKKEVKVEEKDSAKRDGSPPASGDRWWLKFSVDRKLKKKDPRNPGHV